MGGLTTLCSICRKPANHICILCGRHVCEKHYNEAKSICTACKNGKSVS